MTYMYLYSTCQFVVKEVNLVNLNFIHMLGAFYNYTGIDKNVVHITLYNRNQTVAKLPYRSSGNLVVKHFFVVTCIRLSKLNTLNIFNTCTVVNV